ncbi:MAG TPA: transposase [Lachnoclostridium sp.]|jgi:putative transposase|uniref:transposase n=1 Tax=Lacrimispora sp. TaxID=2719234 RepID=UPI000EC72578|nr:transposase [Lacrimispora sp.]HCD46905.1 transposase [Lachnoclostridium sp.]
MKGNKAFQFRMYPDDEQKTMFAKTFGCVRFVYNKMLEDRIDHYQKTGKNRKTTPAKYKEEFPFLKEVDSLALANGQMNLETAYGNFYRGKGKIGFPKFKSKHRDKDSYTTNCVNGNIAVADGWIRLPKVGRVKIKQHREIPDGYRLKSCTVARTPDRKYYVSVLYEYEDQIPEHKAESATGLDFSMKELYIDSLGNSPEYPKPYRKAQEKLAREQRKLSKCKRKSNNYYKQRVKVAKIHRKVANQRKDFLHKQSRQITNAYDAVCIEDLNMKAMSQALNFGKTVADNGWGMFVAFLGYKLEEAGKKLVKVDKWFPSSKTCSVCGRKKDDLELSERVYVCECGNILDRDVNAAINIRKEGMRILGMA